VESAEALYATLEKNAWKRFNAAFMALKPISLLTGIKLAQPSVERVCRKWHPSVMTIGVQSAGLISGRSLMTDKMIAPGRYEPG